MKRTIPTIAALALLAGGAAAAQDGAACEALHNAPIASGFVTSSRVVDATEDLPAYCEVRAVALPAINIEVRLPMEGWNGRYYQAGCGGFCGILGRADASGGWVNAMRPGLQRGYATATSDSGHHGLSVLDGGWAYNNPHAERDWGYRSIGETHRVAQSMITRFYGDVSEQAVFQGCSTGGRMAHVAALRYPEMFDGIISGAPAMDYTGLVATNASWVIQANTDENGEMILKPGRDKLVGDVVMAQCDAVDGAEDGLIADPRQCEVDLAQAQCSGEAGEDCLTAEEIEVVEKWRQGPVNSAGESLYPGALMPGSEPFWWLWVIGNEKGQGGLTPGFATDFGRYMAFDEDPGVNWTPMDFDFDRDPGRMGASSAMYNGDNPDISGFRAAGGKMIVWHGWSDAIVPPMKSVEWHEQAAEVAGGEEALAENVALFMIPGMDHCGIVPGAGGISQASIDPMTALETWMNDGARPASIMAAE